MTFQATLLIPESRVDSLIKTISKLAKRIDAGKTHAAFAPTAEIVGEQAMIRTADTGPVTFYIPGKSYKDTAVAYTYKWVTVSYDRPLVEGWRLTAVYDWTDGPCMVSAVPGEEIPREFRTVEAGRCDHCNVNRARKQAMLITHEDGRRMVVGTTCLKDYLGHFSASMLKDMFSFELSIEQIVSDDNAGGAGYELVPTENVLAAADILIRMFGFTSAKKARESMDDHVMPTYFHVNSYFFSRSKEAAWFRLNNPITDANRDRARKVIEWVMAQDDENMYFWNLQTILNNEACSAKRFGLVVSAVASYNRAQEAAKEAAEDTRVNEHLGTIKVRMKGLSVTVKAISFSDGFYGTTTIVTMEDIEGRSLVWFATNSPDVEKGDTLTIDGTVKDHKEYRGRKQTVLTRVKVTARKAATAEA